MVYHICSIFTTHKRIALLKLNLLFLWEDCPTFNMLRPFDIRWCSFHPAIYRMIELIHPVISTLTKIYEDDKNILIKTYIDYLSD